MTTTQSVINAFIARVAKEGKHTEDELLTLYHETDEYKNANKKCPTVLTKGPNEGKPCNRKCAKDSDRCSKHKPTDKKVSDGKTCIYIITKGAKEGDYCGKNVAKKCPHGVACSAHKAHAGVLAGVEDAPEKKTKKKSTTTAEKKDMAKCCHLLTTGTRDGQECGVSVTEKSSSETLCTRHANLTTKSPTEKKERKVVGKKAKETKKIALKRITGVDGPKIYLEKNMLIVFNESKKVIGGWDTENKEIIDLTKENMKDIEDNKFDLNEGVATPEEEVPVAEIVEEEPLPVLPESEDDDSSDEEIEA
jgi:hypothetical protein